MPETGRKLARKAIWAVAAAFLGGIGVWLFSKTQETVETALAGPPLSILVDYDDADPFFPGLVTSALVIDASHSIAELSQEDVEGRHWRNRTWEWSDIATYYHLIRVEFRTPLDEQVIITSIEPRIIARAAPKAGWFVADGGCGAMQVKTAYIDFDAENPRAELSGFEDPDQTLIYVTKNDAEVVEFFARTSEHYVEWVYELEFTTSQGKFSATIDHDGAPFKVSSERGSEAFTFDRETKGFVRVPEWDDGIDMC
jgi:hypothetical protein